MAGLGNQLEEGGYLVVGHIPVPVRRERQLVGAYDLADMLVDDAEHRPRSALCVAAGFVGPVAPSMLPSVPNDLLGSARRQMCQLGGG